MMGLMSLKDKILDEILEDLDQHEGMKLKPKAAVSITAVKPEEGMNEEPDGDEGKLGMAPGLGEGEDGEDDDELKQLLEHYLSEK